MKPTALLFGGLALAATILGGAAPAQAQFNPFGSYYDNIARAAAQNDASKVQNQLANGASPEQTDDSGHTALQIAAMNGNLQIAAICVKAGAKLDAKDPLGNTALFYAAERNQIEMVKLLLDLKASVDTENRRGVTPLMAAASHGNLEIVQALLAKGANPNKTDFTGRDVASWALDGHRPAVALAIKKAAQKR